MPIERNFKFSFGFRTKIGIGCGGFSSGAFLSTLSRFQGPNLFALLSFLIIFSLSHQTSAAGSVQDPQAKNMVARILKPLSQAARHHLATLEKQWQASLHLKMLATPLRKCVVTQKVLPTALMIQFKAVPLPSIPLNPSSHIASSSSSNVSTMVKSSMGERVMMLPNQVLHPQYVPRKTGKGLWFTLDQRVFFQFERRGSWKILNSRAILGAGMEKLLHVQLGERVCQEVELLVERFSGRAKLDLILRKNDDIAQDQIGFTIRCSETEQEKAQRTNLGSIPVFVPMFREESQMQRFSTAIQQLVSIGKCDKEAEKNMQTDKEFKIRRTNVTVPLGIALYRLALWSDSSSPESSFAKTNSHDAKFKP
ncbi:uncharacterized protein MEPE_04482 [Melanopsichium pennsylvanicum]|uniref:Uncharacterized protein n=1 Tax=Melanopsichium pennsylvanicum TaxID=63383 RepID=A0AAJ4XP69_9BASI|nr:uncharacterized protein MEPE_04482 [Melanopsichium pennsylvanicum]